MKLNKVLLLAAAVLMIGTAVAAPVNPKRAAALAQSFFSSQTGAKNGNRLADVPTEWQYRGIYLFEGADGGFVLVAADDAARADDLHRDSAGIHIGDDQIQKCLAPVLRSELPRLIGLLTNICEAVIQSSLDQIVMLPEYTNLLPDLLFFLIGQFGGIQLISEGPGHGDNGPRVERCFPAGLMVG